MIERVRARKQVKAGVRVRAGTRGEERGEGYR